MNDLGIRGVRWEQAQPIPDISVEISSFGTLIIAAQRETYTTGSNIFNNRRLYILLYLSERRLF